MAPSLHCATWLAARRRSGLSFADLGERLGQDEVWVAIPAADRDALAEALTTYPLKDVIQEQCGDGIMSAIDFPLTVDRVEDPQGDRVKVTMNGKFLPYRKW